MIEGRAVLLGAGAAAAALVAVVAVVARPDSATRGAVDGQVLFVDKGCAACHDTADRPAAMPGVAPSLVGAADWAGSRIEGVSAEEYLTQSIQSPWAFVSPAWGGGSGPTSHMPVLPLTDDEVAAVVDYLLRSSSDGQG